MAGKRSQPDPRSRKPTGGAAAVIYQIYPRSFRTPTATGSAICGIAERLPYIASLGVDAIWISPFFTSPMKDFGYDVSDYTRCRSDVRHAGDFDTWSRWPTSWG
jgi:alpha-glucosidase